MLSQFISLDILFNLFDSYGLTWESYYKRILEIVFKNVEKITKFSLPTSLLMGL